MAYTAERRSGGSGVRDDALGGGIGIRITGCPCGCQAMPPYVDDLDCQRHRRLTRGLAEALDHLDALGLCVCWVAPRRHRRAA